MGRHGFAPPRRSLLGCLAVIGLAGVGALAVPWAVGWQHEADVVATRALVARVTLPAYAEPGCDRPGAGVRCWTTERAGRAAIDGLEEALSDAGVADVTTACHASPIGAGHGQTCELTGSYRGDPVLLAAFPRLLPEPPVTVDGTTLILLASVS